MTKHPELIHPEDSVRDAADAMRRLDVGSLPVCDQRRLVGIVTDRDIVLRAIAEGCDPERTTVREIMTPDVVACFDDQELAEAAQLMGAQRIRRLLVLDRRYRLVGLLSFGDLALASHTSHLTDALRHIAAPPAPAPAELVPSSIT